VQKRKEKRTYEAPKLSFTPLKPEERLLQCAKNEGNIRCLRDPGLS